ncbi:MAG: hypothetical protein WKG07_21590 [Hymenobacter sp.]
MASGPGGVALRAAGERRWRPLTSWAAERATAAARAAAVAGAAPGACGRPRARALISGEDFDAAARPPGPAGGGGLGTSRPASFPPRTTGPCLPARRHGAPARRRCG